MSYLARYIDDGVSQLLSVKTQKRRHLDVFFETKNHKGTKNITLKTDFTLMYRQSHSHLAR